jgi:manganese/zinc/iron transport system permease protein
MVAATLAIGWFSAIAGHTAALEVDASIAGAMGLVASACFLLALLLSPKYGLLARRRQRGRRRREVDAALAAR